MNTKLKYMDFPFCYEDKAIVVDVFELYDDRIVVVLDETIFYPQGGGQPFDIEIISNDNAIFQVKEVKFVDGIVQHIGGFKKGEFNKGDVVTLKIDEERRILNSKLHTLGHVIDEAVVNLGLTDLKPGKGYHFPEGPYIEYIGELSPEQIETFKQDVENETNRILQEGFEVKTFFANIDKLQDFCKEIPDYIPKDKPCRVAIVYGDIRIFKKTFMQLD